MHPEKWRDCCDPAQLPFSGFRLDSVLGYPHAGNDVFHVTGGWQGEQVRAYIKVARQTGAALENEYAILKQLTHPVIPEILDFHPGEPSFLVTRELPGKRLSQLVGQNEGLQSLSCMKEYGRALAMLHSLKISAKPVADRRFFHKPTEEMLGKLELGFLQPFFQEGRKTDVRVFCHGDFHYANLLWKDNHISGILDFELAGIGNRDFDIAWALILRPGQKFMKHPLELEQFLEGYGEIALFDRAAVRYYMAQIYVYFLAFSANDPEYCAFVRSWLKQIQEQNFEK